MKKLNENVKIICLQTPIWKVSCRQSITWGLPRSFNGKLQGISESKLRLVELFTFLLVKQNLFERSLNWVTFMGPLASEITFANWRKKLYHFQKQLLSLLELNFERILHNTEYILRCLKTVWNSWFSKSRNFGSLRLLSRNSKLQL